MLTKIFCVNSNGTTYINLDAADPYTALLGQQWYNQYAAANPSRARTLNRLIARYNKLTGGDMTAQRLAGEQLTTSKRSNYIAMPRAMMAAKALTMKPSEILETIASDHALLRSVTRQHRSMFIHALETIGDLRARHKGKIDKRVRNILARAEANLNYALAETAEANADAPKGKPVPKSDRLSAPEGVRFSGEKKDPSLVTEKRIREMLEDIQNGAYNDRSYIPVRVNTPQRFIDEVARYSNGKTQVDNLPMIMEVGKARQAMEENEGRPLHGGNRAHELTIDDMIDVLKGMDDPKMIVEQSNGRYVEVVSLRRGKFVAVVDLGNQKNLEYMNGYRGGKYNVLVTTYSPDNLKAFLNREGTKIIYEKKGEQPRGSGREMTVALKQSPFFEESIPHPTDEVKFSARRDNTTTLRKPTRPEHRAWLDDYADTYGQIPEGEGVNSRGDQRIPRRIDSNSKIRQTYRTYAEAATTPDDFVGELEREIIDGRASYTPLSNKAAAGYAERKLSEGMDEAMATWNAVTHGDVIADKNQIALGERLIMEAINNRDVKLFTKLVSEVAAEATRAGQMVQAISMVKRLSPEGQLVSFQKEVAKLNEDLANRKGHPQITPDERLTQEYMDIASELEDIRREISDLERNPESRRTERQQDAIDSLEAREKKLEQQLRDKKNEMITNAAEQIPPTWMDKLRAWRYLAMLGNPRTHIRNLLGNAVFIPAVRLKQAIAGGIERMTLKEGNRTQGVRASKALCDFAREDAKTQLDILAAGGKYNQTDAISAEKKSFDDSKPIGKVLNKLAEINSAALEGEDAFFLRNHYQFALSRYAAANRWTVDFLKSHPEALAKARGFAYREAQRATYRDMSSFAQLMSKVSNKMSKARGFGKLGYMMFEGAMPFKKTPCNIMKRGIEYSPLGIASAISKGAIMLRDSRNGVQSDYSGTDFINDLAAGLTGTMIMGLGYLLASLGMLHGRDKDEEDEINAIQGVQEYSVIIGGHSYTVDWVTPVAFPLFVGAELYDQISADRDGYSITTRQNKLIPPVSLACCLGTGRDFVSISVSKTPDKKR